ncbi:MAG: ABC transporter substrate-binding protein, partial [Chloroflexi bacterium]|nr:ABC transporter substrate-binding protein [Chloroflexota bacterium]
PQGVTKGGTYTMAYGGGGTAVTITPFREGSGIQTIGWQLMYNPLVETDPDFKNLVPALAEKWSITPDNLTLTFNLRKDVKWQDGQPFNADDVVFTVKTWLSVKDMFIPTNLVGLIKGGKDYADGKTTDLPGVTAVDAFTVKFTFSAPDPLYMQALNAMPMIAKHQYDGKIKQGMSMADVGNLDVSKSPVGTGPFKIVNYKADQVMEYDKNPNYFRGAPNLDKVVLRIFASDAPISAGVETGEIQSAAIWTKENWPRLFLLKNLTVWTDPAVGGIFRIVPNMRPERKDSPLQDVRFRQAMMYAIPRQKITDGIRLSVSQPIISLINAPNYLQGMKLTEYPYDPEKAKALLKEMNYDGSKAPELIMIHLLFDYGPDLPAIQQAWADVGIKVKLQGVEGPARPKIYADPKAWDLLYSYQTSPLDPADQLADYLACEKPLGECSYAGAYTWNAPARYREILKLQATEMNADKRKALLQEAITILDKEVPMLPLWTEPNTYFINKRVHGTANGTYKYAPGYWMVNLGPETWYLDPK